MLRYVKLLSLLIIAALTSCSYIYGDHGIIQNRDKEYLSARSIPPLSIPPGLSSSTIQAHYPVSDVNYPQSTEVVNLTPPDLNVDQIQKYVEPKVDHPVATPSLKQKAPLPNYYFDPYTRSSVKAGESAGSIFGGLGKLWPWGKKQPAQQSTATAAASGNNSTNSTNTDNVNNTDQTNAADTQDDQAIKKKNYYFDPYSHR